MTAIKVKKGGRMGVQSHLVAFRAGKPAKLDDYGDVLTMDETARVLRVSPHTIRHRLDEGTMQPMPIQHRPRMWSKEHIRQHLSRPVGHPPTRRRAAKARKP